MNECFIIRRLYLPTVDEYGGGCRLFFLLLDYHVREILSAFLFPNLILPSISSLLIFINNLCSAIFYPFHFDRSTVYSYRTEHPLLDTTSFYFTTNILFTFYRLVSVAGNESYN